MWFNQLSVYRLTADIDFNEQLFNEKLSEFAFKPCSQQQTQSLGWVMPLGKNGHSYLHHNNACLMLCLKQQERLLPSAVINEKLEEKILDIQAKESREVYKKEKQTLKEDLIFELLPRAFTRSRLLYAYIDTQHRLIFINSASATKAETLLSHLRETLGSLPVIPLSAKNIPSQALTHWLLQNTLPKDFQFGQNCVLKDFKEGSSVRCTQQNLSSEEVLAHIKAGLSISQIQLIFADKISFSIDDKLSLKQIKFLSLDELPEQDDAVSQFDADFALMNGELYQLTQALTHAFGGEASA